MLGGCEFSGSQTVVAEILTNAARVWYKTHTRRIIGSPTGVLQFCRLLARSQCHACYNNQKNYTSVGFQTYSIGQQDHFNVDPLGWSPGDQEPGWTPIAGGAMGDQIGS